MQTFARRLLKMVQKSLEICIILSKQVNILIQFQSFKLKKTLKS